MMAIAAEFIAWHLVDTGPAEGRTDLRDETWHDHRVHVSGGTEKTGNNTGGGGSEIFNGLLPHLRIGTAPAAFLRARVGQPRGSIPQHTPLWRDACPEL